MKLGQFIIIVFLLVVMIGTAIAQDVPGTIWLEPGESVVVECESVPPTATPVPEIPTETPVPPTEIPTPTETLITPTATSVPLTETPIPPTATSIPPTNTPQPTMTNTPTLAVTVVPSSDEYVAIWMAMPPEVDGDLSEYSGLDVIEIDAGRYWLLWTNEALYVAAEVSDATVWADGLEDGDLWNDDSIELMFDTLHDGGAALQSDDYKFFVNRMNIHADSVGEDVSWDGVYQSVVVDNGQHYVIEMRIPWIETLPAPSDVWGLDISLNDAEVDGGVSQTAWANLDGGEFNNPDGWGVIRFYSVTPTPVPTDMPIPTQTVTVAPTEVATATPQPSLTPLPQDISLGSSYCGQTVVIPNGQYQTLYVSAQCAESTPLVIRAERDGSVLFDGQGSAIPCNLQGVRWVELEGITCYNSNNMVVNIPNAQHVTLRRVTGYQAGPDYNDHIFEIYHSSDVILEDCAATGRGRNTYIAYESDHVTFRRCWGRYVTNGTQQGADWMQIYATSDALIENCVGTRVPSEIYVDVNQYWLASWNEGYHVDRNRTVGSVFYGYDYHGLNVISAGTQLHSNSVENTVFIGNDTSAGFGTPYTGVFQRADDDFRMDHLTLVNHQMAISLSHDNSNPWLDIVGRLINSSIVGAGTGLNLAHYSQIITSLDHHHNNFHNVDTLYNGTSMGVAETTFDPGYDTARYGWGAYLFPPPALQGQAEDGGDLGANVLYAENGERLWPWNLEARVCAETARLLGDGTDGVSVTYESHDVSYDYDGDGQAEGYHCTGGIWRTLENVY